MPIYWQRFFPRCEPHHKARGLASGQVRGTPGAVMSSSGEVFQSAQSVWIIDTRWKHPVAVKQNLLKKFLNTLTAWATPTSNVLFFITANGNRDIEIWVKTLNFAKVYHKTPGLTIQSPNWSSSTTYARIVLWRSHSESLYERQSSQQLERNFYYSKHLPSTQRPTRHIF